MPENKDAILIGYSGHGFVLGDCAIELGVQLRYYAEQNEHIYNPLKLEYLGFEGSVNFSGYGRGLLFMVGIGDNATRKKISERLLRRNEKLVNIIHPSAIISRYTKFEKGIFVSRCAVVNPGVEIGDFAIINTASILEHECKIGKAVHIGPGAILCGNVKVGDGSFIGANSVVRQGLNIGNNVIIGAGSVVVNNIEDNSIVVGNPAKNMK